MNSYPLSQGQTMDDLIKLADSASAKVGIIAGAVAAFVIALPKMLNSLRSDKIDGSVLTRLMAHENRMNRMDTVIHAQQIKITRLLVLVIQLEGLLENNGVVIPPHLRQDIRHLVNEDKQQHKEHVERTDTES